MNRKKILLTCISALKIAIAGCYQVEEETPNVQQREYLQGTVSPCTESARWGSDPCMGPPQDHQDGSNAVVIHLPFLPESLYQLMDGIGNKSPGDNEETHLLFRGIVLPGTERCGDAIRLVAPYYDNSSFKDFIANYPRYWFPCYADFTVHDYIIGAGPKTLTLMLEANSFEKDERPSDSWFEEKEKEMRESIKHGYSGREVILHIAPSWPSSYEGWHLTYIWYLERGEDAEVTVVSYERPLWQRVYGPLYDSTLTTEQLARLEYPLADFEREAVAAHNKFKTETGGRIGVDSSLPSLMTDANDLHSYYVNELRAYENLTATPALPPPVPGENDPFTPGTNVGDPPAGDATVTIPGGPDDAATDPPTPTHTSTATPTLTATVTPTPTQTATATATSTPTPTVTATHTNTPTATAAVAEVPELEPTDTSTPTNTPTSTPTSTATATPTPTETLELDPTDTPTPTLTPTATDTATPTATSTETPTPTNTPTSTPTNTPTPTATATDTPTPTPSATPESGDDGQGGGGPARDTDHDYEWTLYSLTVNQSWHHADHAATFKFACPATTIDDIDFKAQVRSAADVWNALRLGVSFTDGGDTSNCGTTLERNVISVKTFNAKTETSHQCRAALGCVFPPDRSTYPHFDILQLYIPSEFDDTPKNTKEWTTDLSMARTMIPDPSKPDQTLTKHYMPRVIIHELGHTAGLEHSGNRSDIMHHSSTDRATPSDFDQEAMKSIYDSDDHSSH